MSVTELYQDAMLMTSGVCRNVASVAYANYFGRAHIGGITGIATSALVVGSAVGPFPFGLVRDLQGGFAAAFVASGGISLVLAVVVRLPCLLQPLVARSLPALTSRLGSLRTRRSARPTLSRKLGRGRVQWIMTACDSVCRKVLQTTDVHLS